MSEGNDDTAIFKVIIIGIGLFSTILHGVDSEGVSK